MKFVCREWYGYHFPELKAIVTDKLQYAQVVKIIGNRNSFDAVEKRVQLEEILHPTHVDSVCNAIKSSIGKD